MRAAMRAEVVPKLASSVANIVDRASDTFMMFFAESAPDSRFDLLFGLWGTFGRALNFSAAAVAVVVAGCKCN